MLKKNEYDEGTRLYFNKIKSFKPLSLKDEKKLFKSYKKGDLKSRDRLINSNLKFVVHVAKNYRNKGVPFDELISEGNYGLLKSFEKFDIKKDNKLSSYAVHWIRFFIEDKIKRNNQLNKNLKPYLVESSIIDSLKENVYEEQSFTNIEKECLEVIDEEIDYDNQEYYKNVVDELFKKILNKREIEILNYSFGLDEYPTLNLKEISVKLGLSQERIRQIREKALMKLRSKCLESDIKLNI
jgi:RNA polymerase primary sigma factor